MKRAKYIVLFAILLSFALHGKAQAQKHVEYNLFREFEKLYYSNDLIKAEECMFQVLESKEFVSDESLVSAYNNLGVINNLFGRYQESLDYYSKAEGLLNKNPQSLIELAIICSNKARIYNIQKKYSTAIEYLEKSIRIYQGISNPDKTSLLNISTSFMNTGISYLGLNDYKNAMKYFELCAKLKLNYNLSELGLCYLNIANAYIETGDAIEAESFFIKSLREFEKGTDIDYQRIIDGYFEYGLFLRTNSREQEAFEYHTKALALSLKNFGGKHPYVSLAYKYIGDHYSGQAEYNSALQYYQKSLVALVRDFDNLDINVNPSLDSAFLDVDFLKILQKKSEILEQLSLQQKDPGLSKPAMTKSLETVELALQLINRMRNDYMSEESRLYLMGNEKETYIFAAHIARNMYTLTGGPGYLQKMYSIARQAKSAILHNEITGNELFYSIGIPDTLIEKHNRILGAIAAYNNLIHEELQSTRPDNKKTDFWKDALFRVNREKERMEDLINEQFPRYHDLLQKTEPISLEELQIRLKKDETLIEYLLSNKYADGFRKLYIFTVSMDSLQFREVFLDSLFAYNVETIKHCPQQVQFTGDHLINYKKYTAALFYMYDKLIRPAENFITGNKLIVIPDEEIAYLPFDAFIKSHADPDQINYEGLQYLVKSYTFSYGYSSSLIFTKDKNKAMGEEVYAFSPDYSNSSDNSENGLESLPGTGKEIHSIYKYFKGTEYYGDHATESNFKTVMQYPVILHLAMHSVSDTVNSKYSCLIFDTQRDTVEDGNLYDYEISLSRIKSPMVVLSACNTGTGTLYHGEGLMSISRAFILAGASSVVKTLWDVNDDASAKIIEDFYCYLSKGKEKNDALRLAKLEYLKNSPPTYTNPYYWAAYQVMGNKSSIATNRKLHLFIFLLAVLILGGGVYFAYFKRRRSFLA